MAGELKALHGTTTDFTVTNLVTGIANGSCHVTNKFANTSPSDTDIVLSGRITFDNNCVPGDVVNLYLVPLDAGAGDLGELSAGNLAPSSGDAEVATPTAALKLCTLVASLPISVISSVSPYLYFVLPQMPCAYQTGCVATHLISTAGTIGDEGDVIRYQFTSIQAQS